MASKDSNGDGTNEKPDNSEDNFGLPDIEYKPLDQPGETSAGHETVPSPEAPSGYAYPSSRSGSGAVSSNDNSSDAYEEPKSKAPVILGVVIVLVLLTAGYLIYNFVYKPRAEADRVKKEQLAKEALTKKQQDEAAALAKKQAEEERRKQEELAKATPPVGTIEALNAPTKRYYVVVSSDIDDDLLMDFAKKLSAKGVSTKIIPPFGGKNFYRLAITDHDSFASAQTNADAAKADYGSAVWVLKY